MRLRSPSAADSSITAAIVYHMQDAASAMVDSNKKGWSGEHEIENILKAHGYEAGRTGQFKKLDVWWLFRGLKRFLEVKRKKRGWTQIYKAFSEDAWFIGRADYEQWFIAMPLIEYLNQQPTIGKTMQSSVTNYTSSGPEVSCWPVEVSLPPCDTEVK